MQIAIAIVGGLLFLCLAALSFVPRKTEMMDVYLFIVILGLIITLYILALLK